MGSDWRVSTPDPLEEIHVAVNRAWRPGYAYGVGARRGRSCPRSGSTSRRPSPASRWGRAYVNHLDDRTGSIEVGKLADLAVLDRDLFASPVEEIAAASVQLTFVDGQRVYADPSFS